MKQPKIVVEARSLVKRFGQTNVVNGIHFVIREGECYGFLGPNGAGKTSTMRMIYCSSPISAGELFVMGLNVKNSKKQIKARLGVVPQDDGLDPDFTVFENLLVFANFHGINANKARERAKELVLLMHLEDYVDARVETLSGGMRRRLAIARGLINQPDVLILDEPTTGLDPQARIWIWDRLTELKKKGTSLILTTHYMEEAEKMCDRVAVLDHGRVLSEGRPSDLIEEHVGHEVVEFVCDPRDVNYLVARVKDRYEYQILPNQMRLFIKKGQDAKHALSLIASEKMTIRSASLEDVFLKLTGHQLRE